MTLVMADSGMVWFFAVLVCVHGSTLYNAVRMDYEAFLAAYEDTGSSGKSISAQPIIPKDTAGTPLTLDLNMALYAIMDFDAVEGKMEIVGSLNLQWTDEVKALKGVSFSSTAQTLFFTREQIWTPNLVLMNSVDTIENVGDETYKIRYNTSSGVCQWNPRVLVLAACSPDPTYFPFDDQTCTLSIKPVGQEASLIELRVNSDTWDTSDQQGSSIWTLDRTKSSVRLVGGTYVAEFEVTIKRKPMFMTVVIVLPVLLLSLLSGFLFLLPPGCGERVGFGITCFLSFVVLLQTLMDLLPDSSDPMSLLCYYVILMLTLTAILSIVNIFLMRIYISPGKDEVPKGFIYFYKTIKCRPCRACYRKTKATLKPPCLTAMDKIKASFISLFTALRSLRCQDCRRSLRVKSEDRQRAHDRVLNKRFSTLKSKKTSGMSTNSIEIGLDTAPAVSDQQKTSTEVLGEMAKGPREQSLKTLHFPDKRLKRTHSQLSFVEETEPAGDETPTGITEGLLRPASIEKNKSPLSTDSDKDTGPSSGYNSQLSDATLPSSSHTLPSTTTHASIKISVSKAEVENTGDVEDDASDEIKSRGLGILKTSLKTGSFGKLSEEMTEKASSLKTSIETGSVGKLSEEMTEKASSLKTSLETGSVGMLSEEMTENASSQKMSLETGSRKLTDTNIEVVTDDESGDEQDDEDERLLSKLTWEFVGQILDYFFIVTFIALQTTFTIFFIVPLGARYA